MLDHRPELLDVWDAFQAREVEYPPVTLAVQDDVMVNHAELKPIMRSKTLNWLTEVWIPCSHHEYISLSKEIIYSYRIFMIRS